jgi:pimeloyl-ACP methyl ester carboxylesterase
VRGFLFLIEKTSFYNSDLSTANLAYLSSEQGLADLATFRQFIHQKLNLTDSKKWISFGGSYSGSLSAWFRLKYPHLVHGAVSSSAPMIAILDFVDYMNVVNASLSKYSPKCTREIEMATQKVTKLVNTTSGRLELEKLFKYADFYLTNRIDSFSIKLPVFTF